MSSKNTQNTLWIKDIEDGGGMQREHEEKCFGQLSWHSALYSPAQNPCEASWRAFQSLENHA